MKQAWQLLSEKTHRVMSEPARRLPPPKRKGYGKTTTQEVLIQRYQKVEDMMVAGWSRDKILRECIKDWKIDERTGWRYMAAVRDRWIKEHEAERPIRQIKTIKRLERACEKVEEREQWTAWSSFERLLAQVQGVVTPHQHEHKIAAIVTHVSSTSRFDSLEELSDEALAEIEKMADRIIASPPPKQLPEQSDIIDVPASDVEEIDEDEETLPHVPAEKEFDDGDTER